MGAWERSWAITRTSFALIGKDKEMLAFPILSGLFSLLFSVALFVPTFVLDVAREAGGEAAVVGPLQWVVLFVTYFGLSFIATFFNVCVVHTTRVRLAGGDATMMDSLRFAVSRAHLIFAWSLVAGTVGLLLRMLDGAADRAGAVGKIVLSILRAMLAGAWSIITVFVIPAMVYKELGPMDAISDSIATLKKTWGESLIRHYGLGFAAFVCALPCIGVIVLGFFVAGSVPAAGFALAGLGGLALLAVSLVFGVASSVFNTVLYHYATNGAATEGFDANMLAGVFAPARN